MSLMTLIEKCYHDRQRVPLQRTTNYRMLFSLYFHNKFIDYFDVLSKLNSEMTLLDAPKDGICLTDDVIAKKNGVHEQEGTQLLSRYLSKLKFTDADGLILPDDDLPHGYLFNYRRCAHRTLYTPRPGFTMIVSKESTWCRDYKEEESRKTVR